MKKNFFIMITSILLLSCSGTDREIAEVSNIEHARQYATMTEGFHDDFIAAAESKYGAVAKLNDENSYTLSYENGKELNIKLLSGKKALISGSFINDSELEIIFDPEEIEEPEITVVHSACSEHPKNESFNQCFKREWDDFCDGIVGCVTQAVKPIMVAALISAHCLTCK